MEQGAGSVKKCLKLQMPKMSKIERERDRGTEGQRGEA